MANPQPDKFTRISNELYEAIMQTDFSKRQRNILDLVIRMSYGCGKKFAILRPSDFEVVGVYKTHIKKELDYLVSANVLFIDRERIELNKNYEQWRVSLVKPTHPDKFQEILKRNLTNADDETVTKTVTISEPETVTKTVTSDDEIVTKTVTKVTEMVTPNNRSVTKIVTDGYQNSNSPVTKTVTTHGRESRCDAGFGARKENIKENIKKINISGGGSITRTREEIEGELFSLFEENFVIAPNPIQRDKLISYLDDGMEPELIIHATRITRENGKDIRYLWGILNRCFESGVLTLKTFEERERARKVKGLRSRGDPINPIKPRLPIQETVSDEELAALLAQMKSVSGGN